MSDTRTSNTAQGSDRSQSFPRAVVHKRILSVAESRPDASMEAIADDVTGATTSLVEQVLSEYGDPAGDETASGIDTGSTADTDSGSTMDTNEEHSPDNAAMSDGPSEFDDSIDVTEKQRETLCEIRDRPHATQAELAEQLGVTSATISQRVNGIDGFDWSDRQSFVERFFDREGPADSGDEASDVEGEAVGDGATATSDDRTAETAAPSDGSDSEGAELESSSEQADTALGDGGNADRTRDREAGDAEPKPSEEPSAMSDARDDGISSAVDRAEPKAPSRRQSDVAIADRIDELTARVESVERRLTADQSVDPELTRKVLRACFESDRISADEEVAVIEEILAGQPPMNASVASSDR